MKKEIEPYTREDYLFDLYIEHLKENKNRDYGWEILEKYSYKDVRKYLKILYNEFNDELQKILELKNSIEYDRFDIDSWIRKELYWISRPECKREAFLRKRLAEIVKYGKRNKKRNEKSNGFGYSSLQIEGIKKLPFENILPELMPLPDGKRKCRCPFHNERTPSFFVYPSNTYYCFGCQESGDIITLVQKRNNCSFKQALDYLSKFSS